MKKKWILKQSDSSISQDLIEEAGSFVLAKLLFNRGIDTVSKIKDFLNPLKMRLTHYDAFTDIKKSVDRVVKAVENNENITIYGDFDADGITSTAVMYKTLKEIGANVSYYIPDRETESHGLNTKALVRIISKNKAKVIITVDCGVSNAAEVNFANGFNVDVIITDHHEAPEVLPCAYSILNPKAENALVEDLSVEDIESLSYLAGVGVAFKFCCALLQEFSKEDYINELLPLVAVGTIADIVPLLGENRCYVTMGLALIRESKNIGIDRLLKSAGIENIETVNSESIAFSVAPRLNAAGRLDSASTALKLLITDNESEINEGVSLLNNLNLERQNLCDETYKEAVASIEQTPGDYEKAIILYNIGWHIGIIGIVASKLVEKYHVPVFLMTKESEASNELRCSCRSIKGINVHEVLSTHSEKFIHFGGHAMAGGFALDEAKMPFNRIKQLLYETISEMSEGVELVSVVEADMELSSEDISYDLISQIDSLQPFGAGNEYPAFLINNLILSEYRFMGQNSNHLKMQLASDSGRVFECVKWNMPDFKLPLSSRLDIIFTPKLNHFNNNTTIQLDVKEIRSELIKDENIAKIKIFDHRRKTNIIEQVMDYIVNSGKKIFLFAETRASQQYFDGNKLLKDKVFNRNSIPENSDQIMFFDCPPDEISLKRIIDSTSAKALHFMNFSSVNYCTEDFIKTLSGMCKYASKNKGGIVSIAELACVLNVTSRSVELGLELFSNLDMIDCQKVNETEYKVVFKAAVEFSKIKTSSVYNLLNDEINKVDRFKQSIYKADIKELEELIV